MSECRTCEYALYDGMCLAQGKFTLLDAPSCDDYKQRIDVEVSKLKAENAKLRKLVQKLYANLRNRETILELMRMPPSEAAKDEVIAIIDKCSELEIEVE